MAARRNLCGLEHFNDGAGGYLLENLSQRAAIRQNSKVRTASKTISPIFLPYSLGIAAIEPTRLSRYDKPIGYGDPMSVGVLNYQDVEPSVADPQIEVFRQSSGRPEKLAEQLLSLHSSNK